jgi:kynureninase
MKQHFSRFLTSDPARLHAAAHSHHPWPDVTFAAHQQAWLDAARLHDDKWDHVLGAVLPEAQAHIARRLELPDPASIAFASNTHELVTRIVSSLPVPARILTTDAEFHSFSRQLARWEESGRVVAEQVPSAPLDSLAERLAAAAAGGGHDLLYLSHVLFDTGFLLDDLAAVVAAVPDEDTVVVVDGYHGFMAVPTVLGDLAERIFYTAGGYKYAMAGEGVCFLHCPPGHVRRPVDTGWFAGFGQLAGGPGDTVRYASDGRRFLGATFDPSGLYRFNAVQRWLDGLGIDVDDVRSHVSSLQRDLLALLDGVLPAPEASRRGSFLSFRLPDAGAVHDRLRRTGVVTDYRGTRLRIGLGLYHDASDVARLATAVRDATG